MQQIEVGQIVKGKVKGIKNFGAFVELPGGDVGLVHISQVSSEYVKDIGEHLSDGQEVEVKILSIEQMGDKKKISLSIRQAENNHNSNTADSLKDTKPFSGFSNKSDKQKLSNFEDMMAKFKRESDEKMSDLSRRLDNN